MVRIYKDHNLKNLNTLHIPTIAKRLFLIDCVSDLKTVLFLLNLFHIRYIFIGKGSKILFKQEYYDGAVLCFSNHFNHVIIKNNTVYADAGCSLNNLIGQCYRHQLGGLHPLISIPATLGGSIVNNCGIQNCDISDYLQYVICIDDQQKIRLLSKEECRFTYRHSIFKEEKLIVLGAIFYLYNANLLRLKTEMQYQIKKRLLDQEVKKYTCGSLFKNPPGHKAYFLIENAFDIKNNYNGAHLSSRHHNFLINDGNATAADILHLIEDIKKAVYEQFQILLEPELNIVE